MKAARPTNQDSRAHSVLFNRDLPFRGRAEADKTRYTRKAKHKNRNRD